ncbi:PQQ-binding-like beta-propeller repeat protein [Dactylosporangium sp. NPDC048998]|uniref:outer membrane protein assembly factor BamB family protein n=1 Tax=Dactylosporangium sp. NPDC048998 TaxID=3363976 RepID=UPI00370F8E7F
MAVTGAATGPEPVLIDLGHAEPWAPPDTPRRGRGPRRRSGAAARLAALLLVAALAAGLPAADAGPAGGPVLYIEAGVHNAVLGGGRLFVTRYTGEGPHRLDAHDTAGGGALWSTELEDGQQLAFADAGVVVLTGEYGDHAPALSTVVVRDARTGAELWRRGGAVVDGTAGGRLLLLDVSGYRSRKDPEPAPGAGPDPLPADYRIFAVDPRTGAVVWTLTVPPGSQASFGRDHRDPYGLSSLSVLDPDGTLRVYDPASGAVARTYRIEPSGAVGSFELGDKGPGSLLPPGARAGQVAVSSGNEPGDDVFDLATGRRLWHLDSQPYAGLIGCAPGRWCTDDGHWLTAHDAGTGEQVWRVETYHMTFGGAGNDLVLGGLGEDLVSLPELLVVDGRTGAPHYRIDGWHAIQALGGRVVVWRREEGQRATVVGLLDPASGRIAVFGRGDAWGGQPTCITGGGVVACGVLGDLTVWRLPGTAAG